MSTSVFVNAISRSPVSTRRSDVSAASAELPATVLNDRRDREVRDDRACREPHRDRVANLERPRPTARRTSPAQPLLGEVQPEGGENDGGDDHEEGHEQAEQDGLRPGPLELLQECVQAIEQRGQPAREPALPGRRGLITHADALILARGSCEHLRAPSGSASVTPWV